MAARRSGLVYGLPVAVVLAGVLSVGCGGSTDLTTGSTCGEFNDALTVDQLRFMREEFGPHQESRTLDANQVTQAFRLLSSYCDADPTVSLKTIPYQTRLAG